MDITKYRVGKTLISNINPDKAIDVIKKSAASGQGGFICVSNMRMVDYACSNPDYNAIMKESLMNWPDGRPLYWCGRLWGLKDVQCTSGPNVFIRMMNESEEGLCHYLLGDTQDVLDALCAKYPDANIVGAESLPFADVEAFDYKNIAEKIRRSGANVVWTAMTAPKQDVFNETLLKFLPGTLLVGVGRAFRIAIGTVKDAPGWAAKLGIRGLFIGKKRKPALLWWYAKHFFMLMSYFVKIIWGRMIGKRYYE